MVYRAQNMIVNRIGPRIIKTIRSRLRFEEEFDGWVKEQIPLVKVKFGLHFVHDKLVTSQDKQLDAVQLDNFLRLNEDFSCKKLGENISV
jgi:hypothetical protein